MKMINLEVVSPPRCGSTLLWHFCKYYIAGKNNGFFQIEENVNKSHPPFESDHIRLSNFDFHTYYIVSVRHPFSQLASLLIYDNKNEHNTYDTTSLSERYIMGKVEESIRDFKWCYDVIKNNTFNTVLFKYERFVNEYNYFFDHFRDTFGFEFRQNDFDNFYNNYGLEVVNSRVGSEGYVGYSPNHVSVNQGNNEENIKYIPKRYRKAIQNKYIRSGVYDMFNYFPVTLDGIEFLPSYP